jgi:hypothetical protein
MFENGDFPPEYGTTEVSEKYFVTNVQTLKILLRAKNESHRDRRERRAVFLNLFKEN